MTGQPVTFRDYGKYPNFVQHDQFTAGRQTGEGGISLPPIRSAEDSGPSPTLGPDESLACEVTMSATLTSNYVAFANMIVGNDSTTVDRYYRLKIDGTFMSIPLLIGYTGLTNDPVANHVMWAGTLPPGTHTFQLWINWEGMNGGAHITVFR